MQRCERRVNWCDLSDLFSSHFFPPPTSSFISLLFSGSARHVSLDLHGCCASSCACFMFPCVICCFHSFFRFLCACACVCRATSLLTHVFRLSVCAFSLFTCPLLFSFFLFIFSAGALFSSALTTRKQICAAIQCLLLVSLFECVRSLNADFGGAVLWLGLCSLTSTPSPPPSVSLSVLFSLCHHNYFPPSISFFPFRTFACFA